MTTDYRAAPGVNWSSLKHIARSPLHYQHALDNPTPPTAAMQAGTLAHLATLEPKRFSAEVVLPPDDVLGKGGRRNTKAYREWADAQPAGVTIASADEVATAQAIADAVRSHPVAAALLAEARCEVPMFWEDEVTDLPCKGLADILVDDPSSALVDALGCAPYAPILADLKTTSDLPGFGRQAGRMGYHGQLAHYAAGVQAGSGVTPAVYIVAVESAAPHDVAVYRLLDADLERGMAYRDELLATLARCEALGDWPGVSRGVLDLDIPRWA